MNEDDLDGQAVLAGVEKLDHLKSRVNESSPAAQDLDAIRRAIVPPIDTVQLSRSFTHCWALFFNEPELANALEEVASLFGVRIEKRPEVFPPTNMKKRGI